jgi:hypothetical protein
LLPRQADEREEAKRKEFGAKGQERGTPRCKVEHREADFRKNMLRNISHMTCFNRTGLGM